MNSLNHLFKSESQCGSIWCSAIYFVGVLLSLSYKRYVQVLTNDGLALYCLSFGLYLSCLTLYKG